jgi:hypothetical protein
MYENNLLLKSLLKNGFCINASFFGRQCPFAREIKMPENKKEYKSVEIGMVLYCNISDFLIFLR